LPFASCYRQTHNLGVGGDLSTEDFCLISSRPCWAYINESSRSQSSLGRSCVAPLFKSFCAKGLGGIRLAPHFHTPIRELDLCLNLTETFLGSG
ncbi:MAG: hypothetical protein ACPG4N_07205, partial [Gammaproteobacteria bacterium]